MSNSRYQPHAVTVQSKGKGTCVISPLSMVLRLALLLFSSATTELPLPFAEKRAEPSCINFGFNASPYREDIITGPLIPRSALGESDARIRPNNFSNRQPHRDQRSGRRATETANKMTSHPQARPFDAPPSSARIENYMLISHQQACYPSPTFQQRSERNGAWTLRIFSFICAVGTGAGEVFCRSAKQPKHAFSRSTSSAKAAFPNPRGNGSTAWLTWSRQRTPSDICSLFVRHCDRGRLRHRLGSLSLVARKGFLSWGYLGFVG